MVSGIGTSRGGPPSPAHLALSRSLLVVTMNVIDVVVMMIVQYDIGISSKMWHFTAFTTI
jgi:hypothetical protein